SVLENNINERKSEKGIAAHHFRLRHRQHGRRQWISHLVLDDLRGLPRIPGEHDHLYIGQIRYRVQWHVLIRPNPGRCNQNGRHQNYKTVAQGHVDERPNHGCAPPRSGSGSSTEGTFRGSSSARDGLRILAVASRSLDSESIRNCAETTTSSPG